MSAPLKLGSLAKAVRDTRLVITPRMNAWLMAHGDDALPEWVVQKVADQLRGQPRIRHSSFSSSSAGSCQRRQVLNFLGVDPGGAIEPQLQNIFNDGKWRHLRWQASLLAAGIIEEIEFPLSWPQMNSRGTMDGLGIVPADHVNPSWRGLAFGFELKGVSTFQFQQYKEDEWKEEHHKQVDRYFLAGGFDLFVVLYEDKTTQAWFEWVVEPDQARIEASRQELLSLNDSVRRQHLPPMLPGCRLRTGPEWKDCPYAGKVAPTCPAAGHWPDHKLIANDFGQVTY